MRGLYPAARQAPPMQRRAVLGRLAACSMLGVVGCASLSRPPAGEYDIGMSANAFRPESYTVDVDERVVWANDGSRGHTVTAYEGGLAPDAGFFASGGFANESAARDAWTAEEGGNIPPGQRFTHTFTVAGRYPYFCIPHERRGMRGEILVEA